MQGDTRPVLAKRKADDTSKEAPIVAGQGGSNCLGPAVYFPLGSAMQVSASVWTSITEDSDVVQRLLALYFCWEYPIFASINKEYFVEDFLAGQARYCSPILVNALLALGCCFSNQQVGSQYSQRLRPSGDDFFEETKRLFNAEADHHSLTTVQALSIMSLRESSCGRDSDSYYYSGQSIRMAVEMGMHHVDDRMSSGESAVTAATFWGAFELDQ